MPSHWNGDYLQSECHVFQASFFRTFRFCRTDELKRQYTGVLCGLGFDPATGESIYPEHDIEVTFDTVISQEDLKMVT